MSVYAQSSYGNIVSHIRPDHVIFLMCENKGTPRHERQVRLITGCTFTSTFDCFRLGKTRCLIFSSDLSSSSRPLRKF